MPKSVRIVNGYRLLYRPDHFNCMKTVNWSGYVYEHRFVLEAELNRALAKDELVHHLNEDRMDNRRQNLIVLSRADHVRLHEWMGSGAVNSESVNGSGMNSEKAKYVCRRCKICQATLSGRLLTTCSISCDLEYRKKFLRKPGRPSKEVIEEDLKSLSMVAVGAKYGVSDNAVRKWLKIYDEEYKLTLSQALGTPEEGAETSGEVKPS